MDTVASRKRPLRSGQYRCPHPECTHTGTVITKVHCRMHHNMEKDVMVALYGEPEPILRNLAAEKKNLSRFIIQQEDLFNASMVSPKKRRTKKASEW